MDTAGLSTAPAAPAQAGLSTMNDIWAARAAMMKKGMTPAETDAALGYRIAAVAPPTAAVSQEPQAAGLFDVFKGGAAQALGSEVRGVGQLAEMATGRNNVTEALIGAGDTVQNALQTDADRAALQQRSDERAARVAEGKQSSISGFIGDAVDGAVGSLGQMGGTLLAAAGGAAAGTAAVAAAPEEGAIAVAAAAAAAVGGGAAAFGFNLPSYFSQSLDTAKANGLDPHDPKVQKMALASGAVQASLDSVEPLMVLGRLAPAAAESLAKASVAKAIAKGVTKDFAVEASTELAQNAIDPLIFDPKIRENLTKDDWQKIAPYVAQKYGRDFLVQAMGGGIMGGALGGPSGGYEQAAANSRIKASTEHLVNAGASVGVNSAALEAAAADPKQAATMVEAAHAIRGADLHSANMTAAFNTLTPEQQADPNHPIVVAKDKAITAANATRDQYLPQFGGMTTQQLADQKQAIADQQHADTLARAKSVGMEPTNPDLKTSDIKAVLDPYEAAKASFEQAQQRLDQAQTPKAQRKARAALSDAQTAAYATELEARRVLTGADPATVAADQQHERAVQAHTKSEFTGLSPSEVITKADAIIASRPDTAPAKLIAKQDALIAKRRGLSDPAEIDKVNAELATLQARTAKADPVKVAAMRARQAAVGQLGQGGTSGAPTSVTVSGDATEATQAAGAPAAEPQPIAITPLVGQPHEYFTPHPEQVSVPMDKLVPQRARDEGIANAGPIMEEARLGQRPLRAPISVRAEKNGTYTILDGNSTYALGKASGWGSIPVRVITKRQFAQESAPKFAAKIKGVTAEATPFGGLKVTGPEAKREAAMARGKKEGLRVTFTATDDVPMAAGRTKKSVDPRRESPDFRRGNLKHQDELDQWTDTPGTDPEINSWLTDMTRQTGNEYSIVRDEATGELLSAGTLNDSNAVAFSVAGMDAMSDPDRNISFHHSHPHMSPISPADIRVLMGFPGLKALNATLPDGTVQTIRPGDMAALRKTDLESLSIAAIKMGKANATDNIKVAQLAQEAILRTLAAEGKVKYEPASIFDNSLVDAFVKEHADVQGTAGAADLRGGNDVSAQAAGTAEGIDAAAQRSPGERAAQGAVVGPEGVSRALLSPSDFRAEETRWRKGAMEAFQTLDDVYKVTTANKTLLDQIGEDVSAETGFVYHAGPIKTRDSAERKLSSKLDANGKQFPAGRLADYVRGGFVTPTLAEAERLLDVLHQRLGDKMLDEGWVTSPVGYLDRKLSVQAPDGMVMELQLWEPNLLMAKEGIAPFDNTHRVIDIGTTPGHTLYEVIRKPEDHTSAEVEQAVKDSMSLYRSALEDAAPGFLEMALKKVPSLDAARGNRAFQSASAIHRSEGLLTAPGAIQRQASSSNQALPVGVTTPASPSKSQNVTGVVPGTSTPKSSNLNLVTGAAPVAQGISDVVEAGKPFDLKPTEAAVVSPLYTGDLAKAKIGKTGDVAHWLEDRAARHVEPITDFTKEIEPARLRGISRMMATEATMALAKSGHAAGWYSSSITGMYKHLATVYPMLGTGPAAEADAKANGLGTAQNARFIWTYALSVTSQNLNVADNFRAAIPAFEDFVKFSRQGVYRFDGRFGTGDKQKAQAANFAKFAPFYNAMNGATPAEKLAKMNNLFRTKMTVADWVKTMKEEGIPYSPPSSTHMDAEVYGSSHLGPKIGNGFWQNLNGNFNPVTIDLWMRRTWGRLTGKSIGNPEALPAQRARLQASAEASMKAAGDPTTKLQLQLHRKDLVLQRRSIMTALSQDAALKKTVTGKGSGPIKAAINERMKSDQATFDDLTSRIDEASTYIADVKRMRVPEPWIASYATDDNALTAYAQRVLKVWDTFYKAEHAKLIEQHGGGKLPQGVGVDPDLQPEWVRAAKRIVADTTKPIDQVANGTQRKQIEKAVNQAVLMLNKAGTPVTPADLQAILWYPEKDLWNSLSSELEVDDEGAPLAVKSNLNSSYEQEAKAFADGKGSAGAIAGVDGQRARPQGAEGTGPLGRPAAARAGAGTDAVYTGGTRTGRSRRGAIPLASGIGVVRHAGGSNRGPRTGETYAGAKVVSVVEYGDGRHVYEIADPAVFTKAIEAGKASMGDIGAQVGTDPGQRQFLFDDGKSGFALDGGNIISVFKTDGVSPKGALQRVIATAIAKGGNRLDAFDGFLPEQYAKNGFRAVAATPFNREFAPDGWNYTTMGEPNITFMVYDPANPIAHSTNIVPEYDAGIAAQDAAQLDRAPTPGYPQPLYVSRDVNDGTALRNWAEQAGISAPVLDTKDMHMTVLYSKSPVDVGEAPPITEPSRIKFTNAVPVHLGNALALPIDVTSDLRAGHDRYMDVGGSHDYGDSYTPHITIKYDPTKADIAAAKAAQPFTGTLDLTGEIQRTLTPGWRPKTIPLAGGVTVPDYLDLAPNTSKVFAKANHAIHNPVSFSSKVLNATEDAVFNGFAPIRRLELAVKGKLGVGMESAYKASEVAVNDTGRMEALMYMGAAQLGPHGEFQVKPGTLGMKQIFDKAVEGAPNKGQALVDWMSYLAAKRAVDLNARGILTPLSAADIQDGLSKETQAGKDAAAEWKKHNEANIDFLVDTGRIKPAQATALKLEDHYVPFYRSDAQMADGSIPEFDLQQALGLKKGYGGNKGTILSRDPGIKKIIGGDKMAIDNLLSNMVHNGQAMVAAGMRNDAANKTFDLLEQAGLAHTMKATNPGGGKIATPKNAVRMWIGGKEKFVIVDEDAAPVVKAMGALQPQQLNILMRGAARVSGMFRQSITISPAFMVRNLVRGAVATGIMTSGANLTGQSNTITGFIGALRKSDATKSFMHTSGMGDYNFGNPASGFGKDDLLMEYGVHPKSWGYRLRKAMTKLEEVGSATELADRIAAYETLQRNGVRQDEAAYQALTIMNYSRKGNSAFVRAALPMIPFLNARLQGLSRLAEGAVGRRGPLGRKQAAVQLAINGGILMMASAALWAWNNSDEDRRKRYLAEPIWKRMNYHVVFLGDTTVYIPKAFELGSMFSSIPDMLLDSSFNGTSEELLPGLGQILGQTVGFNAIPAVLMPLVEGQSNYSFFRGAPLESQREKGLLPQDRIAGSKALAQFVGQKMGVSDLTGMSPTMIQHYMDGYGGFAASLLSSATDTAAQEIGLTPSRPEGAFGSIPLVSGAAQAALGSMAKGRDQVNEKYIDEFYTAKDQLDQIYNSAKSYATGGDVEAAKQLLAKVPGLTMARSLVNKSGVQIGKLNAQIRVINGDPNLSASDKRTQLAPLIKARNNMTRAVVEALQGIEAKQGMAFAKAG